MGSIFLPHLVTGWHVDQAILHGDDKIVVIRFGNDASMECMQVDEALYGIAEQVKNFASIYVCDTTEVPDFNEMYELWDPVTLMFFYGNQHMLCDFGTGENNKLTLVVTDPQKLIDVIETIYRGAMKGKRFVVSPVDFSKDKKS
ncbi:U4/U6-U5 snRNP complex subunit [Starmerella bacillaris]|uniref:Spliceosomal protein DIB1 n=1 Tax=Starmerella bacillaris TaxID=1247836 RepID=A0AAV5RG47_STABA|nr:U4/U6-U5 snRNP complex subunit [Starmerella bacillaris]